MKHNNFMASRLNIDAVSPATMIVSMIGYVIGLAGMALLSFGSLCFIQMLINYVLLLIPSVVNGQNPLTILAKDFSLQQVLYHFVFITVGSILRKLSGYLCAQETLRTIDRFFYHRAD